jgi:hypothetical protein
MYLPWLLRKYIHCRHNPKGQKQTWIPTRARNSKINILPSPSWVLLPYHSLVGSEIRSLKGQMAERCETVYTQKPNLVLIPYDKVIHTDGQTWNIYTMKRVFGGGAVLLHLTHFWYHINTWIIMALTVLMQLRSPSLPCSATIRKW